MTILYRGSVLMLILSVSAPVSALHVPSHGLPSQPSQQQVEEFCDKYPDLIQSPNLSPQQKNGYEQAYKQYCKKKSAGKPSTSSTLQGRIDRIDTPDCLSPGTEIRVEGEALQQGELACGLESKGRRTSLNAVSKTDRQFRYRLDGALSRLPGPDFRVECKVKGDEAVERVPMCDSGAVTAPGTDDEEPAGGVDLVPEIQAGTLQPGRTQTVEVQVRNLGRSESKNQRHRLMLVLTTQDLTRAVRLTTTLSPASEEVLAETSQWLTRIPADGQTEVVNITVNVPPQFPEGPLFWCAMADSDRNVSEFNERNNVLCRPASDDGQSVERDDLSKLFGAARQQKPELDLRFDPGEESVFPQGATLATLRSTLKVNDNFFSISVPGEGPMTVSWEDLPATIDGDPVVGLLIRFRRNTGFAEDDCLSDPDRWDDLPVDESVIQNPAWPPADRPFDVDLAQTDSSGDRIFVSGRTYFVKACLQVEQGGTTAFVEETNSVEVLYDSYVAVAELSTTLAPPEGPRVGLAISVDGRAPSTGPVVLGTRRGLAGPVWGFTVHYDVSEIAEGLGTSGEFLPVYALLGYSEIEYRACDPSASASRGLFETMVSLVGRDPASWIRPGTTGTVELTNSELRPYWDFYIRLCARGMLGGRETFFVSNQIRMDVQDRTFTPLDLTIEDIQKSGRQTLIVARAELFADYPYPEGTSVLERRLPRITILLKDYSSRERLGGSASANYMDWSEISENVWKVWLLVDYGVPNGYRRHLLAELSSPWLDRYPDNNWLDKMVGSGRRYTEPAVGGFVSHPSDLRDLEITYRDDTLLNFRFILDVSSQTRKLVIDVDPPGELAKMVCREDHTDGSSYDGTSYTSYIEDGIRIATRLSYEYTVRCRRLARYHGEGRIFIRAYDRARAGESADTQVDELIVDYRIAPP